MGLGQCLECGLIQLLQPAAPTLLKPPTRFLYNEPEGHLDETVDTIRRLPGITPAARICGLTSKDTSTLDRLRTLGHSATVGLDMRRDLRIEDETAGVETVQERVAAGVLAEVATRHGPQDLLLVRHVLEHAHDPLGFVAGLKLLLAPQGCVVFEVPDFTTSLMLGDYSTIWEEHAAYFTPSTLTRSIGVCGLVIRHSAVYPYPLENSVVCIAGGTPSATEEAGSVASLNSALACGRRYAAQFAMVREGWKHALARARDGGRQIALLGAGHLAISFINLLGLRPFIDFVVDDSPAKFGAYLPGSKLPILPTEALYEHPVELCLIAVAPESESRVVSRHRRFLDRGGRFGSIFPASELAFQRNPQP